MNTLIELITALKSAPQNLPVYFQTGEHPDMVDSWRGSYDLLALNHTLEGSALRCSELIDLLDGAIGSTFRGYKGGEYTMHEDTPIWVDNYGEYTEQAIHDVLVEEFRVVLVRGYKSYT